MKKQPGYIVLYEKGILTEKIKQAESVYRNCHLCPHHCEVDRMKGSSGFCKSDKDPLIASYMAHYAEEPQISGKRGSGTIFFAHCNMRCLYCQNHTISQKKHTRKYSYRDLAMMMIYLQQEGCHNINLVSPSHMIYPILQSLEPAIKMGLQIPLVYNSGGYDSPETLKLIEGIIDIYLPDFKYSDSQTAKELSGVTDYPSNAKDVLTEMYQQVGNLQTDEHGIAEKGLLVRHLVLPDDIAGSYKVIDIIASLSSDILINIMGQYYPAYQAGKIPALAREVTSKEFYDVVNYAKNKGLRVE